MGKSSLKAPAHLIHPYVDSLVSTLEKHTDDIVVCGSLRRKMYMVSDIDLVVTCLELDDDELCEIMSDVIGTPVSLSYKAKFNARREYSCRVPEISIPLKIDIWRTEPDLLGAGTLYATGPGVSNVVMRRWARYNGLELYFNGVFKRHNDELELIAGRTEEECCEAIDWDLEPPERRFDDERYFGKYLDIMNGEDRADR